MNEDIKQTGMVGNGWNGRSKVKVKGGRHPQKVTSLKILKSPQ